MTAVVFLVSACGDSDSSRGNFDPGPGASEDRDRGPGPTPDPRMDGQRLHGLWPDVWSQHAPGIKSWEYKVNCAGKNPPTSHTDPCFLSDLTAVNVEAPDGTITELDYDFNTNEYSGEITRRWVKYGPPEGKLPEKGDYIFRYWRGQELAYEQVYPYASDPISYPTDVTWERQGDDILVNWTPPPEADSSMSYKTLIWKTEHDGKTISKLLDWDASSGVMEDVPLEEGVEYSLNVAIYFANGYAYSDYVIFDWPAE